MRAIYHRRSTVWSVVGIEDDSVGLLTGCIECEPRCFGIDWEIDSLPLEAIAVGLFKHESRGVMSWNNSDQLNMGIHKTKQLRCSIPLQDHGNGETRESEYWESGNW